MKSKFLLLAGVIFVLIDFGESSSSYAQSASTKSIVCKQTAEEIMSEISNLSRLSHDFERVLVAGEVSKPRLIDSEESLSLSEVLASAGGLKRSARRSAYILERISEGEFRIGMEVDLGKIYRGDIADPKIEKGNIVFVPRRCSVETGVPTDDPIRPRRLNDSKSCQNKASSFWPCGTARLYSDGAN